jgi:hypothetical protein
MFPNFDQIEPERGLVVHLDVGIHVADVAVADQVHVTKFFNSTNVALTTWRHVRQFKFFKFELIFTIVILQLKTGVKSTLTSQIKELGAIPHFWH